MDSSQKKNVLGREVPVWLLIVMLIITAAIAGVVVYHRTKIYTFAFTLPPHTLNTQDLQYGSNPALSNSNYFAEVKDQFIASHADFIEADLSAMIVRVYKSGEVVKELPIKTKGKEGSWWETPAGIYKIETKEKSHFSSIGKVYQPYSMAFQGNFFIHGWPYHPDGTPVATTYSGGCIRLETADAEQIYNLASVGMPILVFEKDFKTDTFKYSQGPTLNAEHYLVADLKNDTVLMGKDLQTPAPIASITQLVTGLVAAEYIDLDREITISSSMLAPTSKPRLQAGQSISVYNLMFPLLMESSNEAAAAIAAQLGNTRIITLMNQKAVALGMTHTTFVDASGSGSGNSSTPEDLFALAKYLYNNRSFILKITTGSLTSSAYGSTSFRNLENVNLISAVSDTFVGGKIGKTTTTGDTYLGIFEVDIHGEKRPIVVTLLNSTDINADFAAIFNYLHAAYDN